MINSGKIQKYVLYALGEIALVVIGILIALQINNWNLFRLERQVEKSTLLEIKESLETDILLLQNQTKTQSENWNKIKDLLNYLEENKLYEPSLDYLIVYPLKSNHISLNTSAFELLERRGIDMIINKPLQKALVSHFKYDQHNFLQRSEVWKDIHYQFTFFYEDFFEADISAKYTDEYILGSERLFPIDYNAFRSDPKLRTELKYRIHRTVREGALIAELIEKKKVLLEMVTNEIEKS